jgi:hypothetical protein
MRSLFALSILLIAIGCTPEQRKNDMDHVAEHSQHHAHQHGGHQDHTRHHDHQHGTQSNSELVVATDPAKPVSGDPVTLRMMIHAADGRMVKDFEVVHDEKVHLVIVREDLDQFAHIHPAIDAKGNLTVSHTFPVGGKYRLFADYSEAGGAPGTAIGSVLIGGESQPGPALVANAPGGVEADGISATISAAPLKAGDATKVSFELKSQSGAAAQLETFMGAIGHLMFVSDTGKYVHVHPTNEDLAQGMVAFEAYFPEPSLYKGWGQFKHHGQIRVIPFVIEVR